MKPLVEVEDGLGRFTPIIHGVLELAAALDLITDPHDRRGFLEEIKQLTTGYERSVAAWHVLPDHPDFGLLHRMFDALVALQGLVRTKAGWFTIDELRHYEVRQENSGTGERLIVFPVAYPYRTKPDEHGNGGVRADALYRAKDTRAPKLGEFGQTIRVEDDTPPTTSQSFWGGH